jgi:hypothetical protein
MTASPEASPVVRARKGRAPDFFIVGHAKSGTTALYEMLRGHPQIYMPDLKETRFFARELHPSVRPSKRHPETVEEYLGLFAGAVPGQRAGEASPSYLRSHDAAGRIARMQPDARIIAILREPASFLRSLHLQLLQAHVETEKDLGKAIALEGARSREKETRVVPQGLMYLEHVRYVEQLERFHAVFPRERVLVLIYDDFRADNEGTVRRVLRFLEVDDTAPIEVTEANPTVQVRSPRMYELVRSIYMGRGPVAGAVKRTINTVTPRRLRHDALALQVRAQWSKPRPPDERLMLELRRRFKGEVLALSEYLNRDLVSLWGYEDIS